ncbi:MAG TPA: ABC transporter permease subunit [Roseiarcus sp.]|nr:ABC transporter permease subunit [Roseiarcus sp.]
MERFIAQRLLSSAATLFAVITIAFFLMRVAPGGPFNLEHPLDPRVMENLQRLYHLDEPVWRQYLTFLSGLARGDLGPSFTWRDFSVAELLGHAFPISAGLGATALVLASVIGVAAGAFAAFRHRRAADQAAVIAATFGIAIPSFVIAPLLQLLFGLALRWLPIGGWEEGGVSSLVLPIVTLAAPQAAIITRLTRASMIEALAAPSIRTLRAYGMPRRIIFTHALRAALAPVVSYLGPAAAALMTGSVVVETIFGIPGLGRSFVDGALNRDYTLVMGATILVAALIIFFNLLVDIAYALIDPRVRP